MINNILNELEQLQSKELVCFNDGQVKIKNGQVEDK